MQTETSGAAEAIKEVERLAKEGMAPQTIALEVPDGGGGKKPVPVLIHDGRATVLADAIREAAKVAQGLRATEEAPPGWRAGRAEHQSLASFIAHVERFKSAASVVWANAVARRLVSVLDYHPEGSASPAAWGRHRGIYASPLSSAWIAWGGEKGLILSQEEFAELLDSRDFELIAGDFPGTSKEAPSPAALVTLANNLEVYSTATAKRERDANTGRVRISFTEEKGVSGAVMPPPAFLVLIRIFQDSEPTPVEIRLRVTVDGGQARFAVQIHAAGDVLRAAFEGLCETVRDATSLPVFVGESECGA